MMTREKLVYSLAVHLIGLLAVNEYLDLEGDINVRGEVVEGAVKLTANELGQLLPTFIDRLKDIDDNLAGTLAPVDECPAGDPPEDEQPVDEQPVDEQPLSSTPFMYVETPVSLEKTPQGYRIRCPRCEFAAQSAKKTNVWRALVEHLKRKHRLLLQQDHKP